MHTENGSMSTTTKIRSTFFHSRILVPAAIIAFVLGCRFLAAAGLHDFANSADEWAYQFQAMTLAQEALSTPAVPHQEALSPFYIITHNERVFSIFPPGWPVLLSLGERLGMRAWVNPLLTGLCMGLVWVIARRLYDEHTAWLSLALFGASAWVPFNGASYFAHPACLLFILGAIRTLLLLHASFCVYKTMFAGLLMACAFPVREYTTVLLLAPFVVYSIATTASPIRFIAALVLGALPVLTLLSLYNHSLTGSFWMPPRFLLEDEGIGFGERTIRVFDYVETQHFGLLDGLNHLLMNLGRLFVWTVPGLPLLALVGFWLERRSAAHLSLATGILLLMLGYVLYPSDGGNQYGPRFFFEASGILSMGAAHALIQRCKRSPLPARTLWLGGFLLFIASAALFTVHLRSVHEQIEQRTTLFRLVEQRNLQNALVFVGAPSGDMTQGDLIRNPPGLHANVLYAWDLGRQNRLLQDTMPGRSFYRFGIDPQRGSAYLEPLLTRVGEME